MVTEQGIMSKQAPRGTIIRIAKTPIAFFDASHGQPNWAQTGFTSREMHTNYSGLMEMVCRLGCRCATSGQPLSAARLADTRLLVIPPPTGSYNVAKECWLAAPETLFTSVQMVV